jgi:hypothetical protein
MSKVEKPVVVKHDGFFVVRDDFIEGGTKFRGAQALIDSMPDIDEFVYGGGSAYGFAQIALAKACQDNGKKFTMFLAKRKVLHPCTARAVHFGCNLIDVKMGMLSVTQSRARKYVEEHERSAIVPMGLDYQPCIDAVAEAAHSIGKRPKEVWCAAGSGTLARALKQAWPSADVHAVSIGHKLSERERGQSIIHDYDRPFNRPSRIKPPFPSVQNYDAKAYEVMLAEGSKGALFWNVAGDVN